MSNAEHSKGMSKAQQSRGRMGKEEQTGEKKEEKMSRRRWRHRESRRRSQGHGWRCAGAAARYEVLSCRGSGCSAAFFSFPLSSLSFPLSNGADSRLRTSW